jgi:hypothetical protein
MRPDLQLWVDPSKIAFKCPGFGLPCLIGEEELSVQIPGLNSVVISDHKLRNTRSRQHCSGI